jgi:hypothetical protein
LDGGVWHDLGGPDSPVPGMTMRDFNNYVVRALHGDTGVPPSILALIKHGDGYAAINGEEGDADWWLHFAWERLIEQRLSEIAALIDGYHQMADAHHALAEKARARMREAADRLAALDDFEEGVDLVLAEKERTGRFDREAASRLLKSRGVEISPDAPESELAAELVKLRKEAREERLEWTRRFDGARAEASFHDAEELENRRRARELIERRDAILNGGIPPEEQERALRGLAEYALDVQRSAVKIEQQRGSVGADELRAAVEQQVEASQTKNEEAEFMAGADSLLAKFAVPTKPEDPSLKPPASNPAGPPGPGVPPSRL